MELEKEIQVRNAVLNTSNAEAPLNGVEAGNINATSEPTFAGVHSIV